MKIWIQRYNECKTKNQVKSTKAFISWNFQMIINKKRHNRLNNDLEKRKYENLFHNKYI